ncbi:MAG: hypothetical protein KBD25_01180 [Rickettsiaceae bacterium]|nr:hypothetical protein [Rickettsiaceae bacterium]
MDLKTTLVIIALAIGSLLLIGPYLSNLINTVKKEVADGIKPAPQPQPQPQPQPVQVQELECLISLVKSLDDKEITDLLVDKVAPQLIRQKLK